jgi:hypothetical protein
MASPEGDAVHQLVAWIKHQQFIAVVGQCPVATPPSRVATQVRNSGGVGIAGPSHHQLAVGIEAKTGGKLGGVFGGHQAFIGSQEAAFRQVVHSFALAPCLFVAHFEAGQIDRLILGVA